MSSIINPNNNNLFIAGNLTVEDFLTVRKDVEILGDMIVNEIECTDITSENIENSTLIETQQLRVDALTQLYGDTQIFGTLTVDGVDINEIGTPSDKIEFYYGEYMELDELIVNDTANIANLVVEDAEIDSLEVNTEFFSLGTSEVEDLLVNTTLDVSGDTTLEAQFEMIDKEYKKDFFDEPVANTIYVKTDGDDNRSGREPINAVATIERATEIARELRREIESPILISVYPGIYVEDGSLQLPDRTGLYSIGGQYTTELHMSDLGRKQFRNMILMDSGCYCQGFAFRNMEVDDLDDPSGGFAYAFAPGAVIKRSPYCRDSSQLSNENYLKPAPPLDPATGNPAVGKGGGMVLADRSVVSASSTYPYMLCFGATPRSNNGLGYVAKNGAGINGISSMTIYQRTAFYALNGGQLTLNNSGTQFGDISLRSSGNTIVVSPATVSSTDVLVANVEVSDAILANAEVITDQLWDDLVANGPDRFGNVSTDPNFVPWTDGFTYDVALCQRDVGYIVNAVIQDLRLRTNYNSITAGMSYNRNITSTNYVNSSQFNQTLAAIDYVKDEVIKISSSTNKKTISNLFETVTKTIRTKDIAKEIYYELPVIEPYNEEKCFRDVGLIIKAVALDSVLETNYNAVTAGLSYRRASANKAVGAQLEQTVSALDYARDTLANVGINAATQTKLIDSFNQVITIIDNPTDPEPTVLFPPTYASAGITGDHVTATTNLQTNKSTFVTQVISYITTNYPELEYNQAKCERDVGYIVDGLSHDMLYGGTFATVTVAQSYFVDTDGPINPGVEGQLGEGESTATLSAYDHLKTLINAQVTTTTEQEIVSDLLDIIINAIKKATNAYIPEPIEPTSTIGGFAQTDYNTVLVKRNQVQTQTIDYINSDLTADELNAVTTNADDAHNQLKLNKEFILDKAIAYVTTNYPGLSYDTASCRRDAGYILDGILHDVLYGGDVATNTVARSYYSLGTLVVPPAEKAATIATWNDMSAVMQNVVQGTEAGQQTYPYDLATGTEATVIANLMTTITNYIDNPVANPLPTDTQPDAFWVDTVTAGDYSNISAQISTIQTDTTDYLDALYSNYFETICKKDDKILVESIALDIGSAKEMVTQAAALAYFNYKGDLVVPAEQLPAFQHVWAKLKQILQDDYAGGAGTDVGIMIGELVDAFESTVTDPITVVFGSLVESLAHQFNNAGAGVNTNALPLNFNKPGFNRPVPFSILQENGGRVRWSGADEINNQYFAGGTRINGQTGKFEGRPFNISVRAIARRLANSRGSF